MARESCVLLLQLHLNPGQCAPGIGHAASCFTPVTPSVPGENPWATQRPSLLCCVFPSLPLGLNIVTKSGQHGEKGAPAGRLCVLPLLLLSATVYLLVSGPRRLPWRSGKQETLFATDSNGVSVMYCCGMGAWRSYFNEGIAGSEILPMCSEFPHTVIFWEGGREGSEGESGVP